MKSTNVKNPEVFCPSCGSNLYVEDDNAYICAYCGLEYIWNGKKKMPEAL